MIEASRKAQPFREAPDFLAGGGELGERTRALQWTRTPLGSPGEWPQPLRHALRLMLASRQPMSLWWGDGHTHLYNDACRVLLGTGHPSALGMAARVVWGDWWDELEPRADAAIRRHEGSTTAPLRFLVERHGRALESYFTMSAHAVPGEHGAIGGVLWTFNDITASVLREREMAALSSLRRHLAGAKDARAAFAQAGEGLAAARHDLPFVALYSVDAARTEARLAARCGAAAASEALPEAITLGDACPWPFPAALMEREGARVRLDDPRFGRLPHGPWDRAPREALMLPVCALDGGATLVLVAGLNPYRVVDDAFERFVDLAASAIASAIQVRAQVPSQEARPPERRATRILVADDNRDAAETLQIMLEMMGSEVRIAKDGQQAVEIAAAFAPDLILMDIGMPKLDGHEACARIRAAGSDAFIVALTGWAQDEDKARSRQSGFDEHLVKPVDPAKLESLVAAIT